MRTILILLDWLRPGLLKSELLTNADEKEDVLFIPNHVQKSRSNKLEYADQHPHTILSQPLLACVSYKAHNSYNERSGNLHYRSALRIRTSDTPEAAQRMPPRIGIGFQYPTWDLGSRKSHRARQSTSRRRLTVAITS